jgi:hypothetical protein
MDQAVPGRSQWIRFHLIELSITLLPHELLPLAALEFVPVFLVQSRGVVSASPGVIQ